MEHSIAQGILTLFTTLGYGGIVIAMALESCCIPLPGELIMPLAGFLAFEQRLSLWGAALAGTVGCVVGSVFAYWIGARGGRPVLLRYGRYALISPHDADRADAFFARYGAPAIFATRLMPIVRSFISLPAGIAGMSLGTFVVYTFLGSLPWCLALAFAGYVLGAHWQNVGGDLRTYDLLVVIALLVLVALYVYRHIRRRQPGAWRALVPVLLLLLPATITGRHWDGRSHGPAPAVARFAAIAPTGSTMPATKRHIRTVFLIVMENHNWSDIKSNPAAPYINHTLLPRASHAEQYYNPPGNHPSLPNYLWLEAGTNFGIGDDDDPRTHHLGTTHHLVALLRHAGISWKAYQEGISGTACPLTDSDAYAPKHDPFMYFDDVTGANNPRSAYCMAHVRPYTQLASDLRHNTVARYNFITPNECDDMHDTCSPQSDAVKQRDSWLAQQVPLILNSQAYKRGGALFITWDEGSGDSRDGPIGLLVLSPYAKGHGYASRVRYTHSSTLRTLEEIFGVRPLLGDAAHAPDLRDLFASFL